MSDLQDILDTLIAEGGGQGEESMRRIAETIINRAAVRGLSFGDVVRQPHQYTGFSSPGPAAVRAQQSPSVQEMARRAWETAILPGDPTGGADHYFNPRVVDPGWQRSMRRTGSFGGHEYFASRPIPPGNIENAVASALDVVRPTRQVAFPRSRPQTRNVALPQARPMSPSERIAQMFAASFTAPRDAVTGAGLDQFIARQQPDLTRGGEIDRSVNGLRQDATLGDALARMIERQNVPAMPTGVGQTYAGQDRISPMTVESVARMLTTPSRPQTFAGQDRALPSSGVGRPPATRVVQSVPVPQSMFERPTSAARKVPLTIGARQTFAGQDRLGPPLPKMDPVDNMPIYGDLTDLFGVGMPQAKGTTVPGKGTEKLQPNKWDVPEEELLAMHGLTQDVPLPNARPTRAAQVPPPRQRPNRPRQQVAITQPVPPPVIAPRPAAPRPAMAYAAPRPQAGRPQNTATRAIQAATSRPQTVVGQLRTLGLSPQDAYGMANQLSADFAARGGKYTSDNASFTGSGSGSGGSLRPGDRSYDFDTNTWR